MKSIAKQIYEAKENIILIYAFNATGKTRLSVAYKDLAKKHNGNRHAGVYYNAYSEDLFYWDNDEEHGNQDVKLNIVASSLNQYHTNINEDVILEKLASYRPKYKFFLNPSDEQNPEAGFGSVSFYLDGDDTHTPIKISRGEERIFIWCFFLALFDVDDWAGTQNQHFFIDDPVSSMDDHNIFITADLLLQLLKKYCDNRKIIITTHHMGIFSILQDWLKKGEYAGSFKAVRMIEKETKGVDGQPVIVQERKEENKYLIRFLEVHDGVYRVVGYNKGIHLYHLMQLAILKEASDQKQLNTYHFVILRQILECVASFVGEGRFSYVLDILFPEDTDAQRSMKANVINALSHDKIYTQKIALLNDDNRLLLETVLDRLISVFHFSL